MMAAHRLPNIAPIGSLLKGVEPRRKKIIGRDPRERDERHLAMIRQLPCLVPTCGTEPCQAAHIRMSRPGKTSGMGEKPHDRYTVPLCVEHHSEQHRTSEEKFWAKHDIDPLQIAKALHRLSPDLEGMRAIVKTVHAIDAMEQGK